MWVRDRLHRCISRRPLWRNTKKRACIGLCPTFDWIHTKSFSGLFSHQGFGIWRKANLNVCENGELKELGNKKGWKRRSSVETWEFRDHLAWKILSMREWTHFIILIFLFSAWKNLTEIPSFNPRLYGSKSGCPFFPYIFHMMFLTLNVFRCSIYLLHYILY